MHSKPLHTIPTVHTPTPTSSTTGESSDTQLIPPNPNPGPLVEPRSEGSQAEPQKKPSGAARRKMKKQKRLARNADDTGTAKDTRTSAQSANTPKGAGAEGKIGHPKPVAPLVTVPSGGQKDTATGKGGQKRNRSDGSTPTKLRLLQTNLHHCKAASYALHRYVCKTNIDLILIQEPWLCKGDIRGLKLGADWELIRPVQAQPRTCILARKSLKLLPLWELCSRDLMVAKLSKDKEGRGKDFVVGSAYLPYDDLRPPPTPEVKSLVQYCERRNMQVVIGCDSNAHNVVWGSTGTNDRGKNLLEFIASHKLEIANRGNEPTFVTRTRREVIDITFGSSQGCSQIKHWHVSNEPSLSDHRYIRFDIGSDVEKSQAWRNPRNCDWDLYKELLAEKLKFCPPTPKSVIEVDVYADYLLLAITESFEGSCALRERKEKRHTPWWTQDLTDLRNNTRRCFNRAKKTGEWEQYKKTLTEYNNAIRKAKRSSWRRYCESIEKTAPCARLQKALKADDRGKLGTLKLPTGKFTTGEKETLQHLLEVHFPGCKPTTQGHSGTSEAHRRATKEDWKTAENIVTMSKLVWAIKSFEPYKTPGPDGVLPVLLQKGLDEIKLPLEELIRASIALSYIPDAWRQVRVVFIPKPGRETYAQAKSFRPISLSSFLLKTAERLIDRYIWDEILRYNPLSRNQYAYQKGKSCEQAIQRIVSRAERAIANKEIALGLFLDIEGAFNNTSFHSMKKAAEKRGVARCVVGWIDYFLRSRLITSTLGNDSVSVSTACGCPQGGVLSPLLWCLVVDELLLELENEGIHATGYADDVGIIVDGKFGATVSNRMQSAIRLVERWCNKEGLTVNAAKTSVIAFTRRRKLNIKELTMWGQKLQMKEEVKYLGITLDTKLNFTPHLEHTLDKATRILWTCRSFVGKSWGLKPRLMLWLYTRIVVPIITYSCIVWWHRTVTTRNTSKLGKLQRLACLCTTGAMSTTPTASMEAMLGLPPLHLVVEHEALMASYRLKTCGVEVNHRRKGLHSTIFDIRDNIPLLIPQSDRIVPTYVFEKPFRIAIEERGEETNVVENNEKNNVWYTDGSKTGHGAGIGVKGPEPQDTISVGLGLDPTVLQTELLAIMTCTQSIMAKKLMSKTVIIYTDSQAALKALQAVEIRSKLTLDCTNALKELAEQNSVLLKWVPGHQGIKGNEMAHDLARKATQKTLIGPGPTCAVTYEAVRTALKQRLVKKHTEYWWDLPGLDVSKCTMGRTPWVRGDELLKLSRKQMRLAVGLLTGHSRLNAHLYKIGRADDPMCRACEEEDETSLHILCHCKSLQGMRKQYFGVEQLEWNEIEAIPIGTVLDYVNRTGLLQE